MNARSTSVLRPGRGTRPRAAAATIAAALLLCSAPARAGSLNETLSEEQSVLERLERIAEDIARCEGDLADVQRDQRRHAYQIEEADRRARALLERLRERDAHLRVRLRALYKLSRGGLARLLLDAADGRRLARRLLAVQTIVRRDAREVALYRRELRQVAREKQVAETERSRHEEVVRHLQARRRKLDGLRAEQERALGSVRDSRRSQVRLARELDQRERALLDRIGELDHRVRSAGGFTTLKGQLRAPVDGPIVGVFGRAVVPGQAVEVLRNGVTFRPSPRATVRATARGVVRMTGTQSGYGHVVVLEHGDGYFSLYGFLADSRVSTGNKVVRGAELGNAGIDPLTGRPAVYFELRHNERAVDPVSWIRRR